MQLRYMRGALPADWARTLVLPPSLGLPPPSFPRCALHFLAWPPSFSLCLEFSCASVSSGAPYHVEVVPKRCWYTRVPTALFTLLPLTAPLRWQCPAATPAAESDLPSCLGPYRPI